MQNDIAPLIVCDDGNFELHEPTLEWFSKLDKPFGIISCAGKFRTGKSFLLNRILDSGPSKGFGVGETVQACTKGLWISKNVISASDDLNVIVMDTEGIDALDASSEHDTRIFTLGILLSSIFLYNSVGHIDETAIKTLSFMSKVSEFIDCDVIPPKFYWILRDFSLQMVDKNGKNMSNREYLEYSLNQGSDGKSETRNCIKTMFKERDLYTLPRPSKTDTAQNLNKKHSNLNPKFMSEMGKLREMLLDDVKPICAAEKPMTGPMFVKMCRILVEKVKSSQMPVMKDAWSMLRELQHNDLYRSLVEELEHEVENWEKDSESNLKMRVIKVENNYLRKFEEQAMSPFESSVYESFNTKVSFILEKAVDKHKINMEELVVESFKCLNVLDINMIEEKFELFVKENGEHNTCKYWFGHFLKCLNSSIIDFEKEKIELGKNEAKEELRFELSELQNKYNDSMDLLKHEKEQVLSLKTELFSLEAPNVIMIDSSTITESCDEKNIGEYIEKNVEESVKTCTEKDETNVFDMKMTIEDLTSENEFLKSSIEVYKKQISETKSQVEKEVESLKSDHMNAIKIYEDDIKQEKHEKENLIRSSMVFEEKVRKLSDDIEKLEEKNVLLQDKFMEFHNKTMEDIKNKDLESRQINMETTKEILGVNRKLQEEKKNSAVSQTETVYLKRQLEDFEALQQEHKRIKREFNETIIVKTRNETELSNTKFRLNEISRERDILRKQNMQLENKVAVLETTGIVNSCKKSILDN